MQMACQLEQKPVDEPLMVASGVGFCRAMGQAVTRCGVLVVRSLALLCDQLEVLDLSCAIALSCPSNAERGFVDSNSLAPEDPSVSDGIRQPIGEWRR